MQPALNIIDTFRTNNFNDNDIVEKFTQIWQKTFEKNSQQTLYGVYFDYETNYKGDYSFATATDTPIENTQKIIPPSGNYKIFKTQKDHVFQTWQEIWQLEENGKLNRNYLIDYEKYLPTGDVEIHIDIH